MTVSHINRYLHANEFVGGAVLLDAASGSGYGSMLLSSVASYRGIDLDPRAIKTAEREFPEFEFIQGSVYDLPFKASQFTAITSFETLEHVDNPRQAMSEFARVLAFGGKIIGSIPVNHPDTIYHFRPYSAEEAHDIFASEPLLTIDRIYRQTESRMCEISTDELGDWPGGTLVAHLRR